MWFIVMKYMTDESVMARHTHQHQPTFMKRYIKIWR